MEHGFLHVTIVEIHMLILDVCMHLFHFYCEYIFRMTKFRMTDLWQKVFLLKMCYLQLAQFWVPYGYCV